MMEDLRSRVPNMALRTTVIVGFPGETDADFEELCAFITEARFDRLGAFIYSHEEASRAAELDGAVPQAVKEERYHRVMTLQQEIQFAANAGRVGKVETVLVDAAEPGSPLLARSTRDAPEVDANVLVEGGVGAPGDFLAVEITGTSGYDLRARPVSTA
jgi:ribosomal protein S12 methylthiotransferase